MKWKEYICEIEKLLEHENLREYITYVKNIVSDFLHLLRWRITGKILIISDSNGITFPAMLEFHRIFIEVKKQFRKNKIEIKILLRK